MPDSDIKEYDDSDDVKGRVDYRRQKYEIKKLKYEVFLLRKEFKWFNKTKWLQSISTAIAIFGAMAALIIAPAQWERAKSEIPELKKELEEAKNKAKVSSVEFVAQKQELKNIGLEYSSEISIYKIKNQELELQIKAAQNKAKDAYQRLTATDINNEDRNRQLEEISKDLATLEARRDSDRKRIATLENHLKNSQVRAETAEIKYSEKNQSIRILEDKFSKLKARISQTRVGQIKLAITNQVLSDGKFYNGKVFLRPNLSQKELDNAMLEYASNNLKPVAQFDITLFGSGKAGFVFGEDSFSYSSKNGPHTMSYNSLNAESLQVQSKTTLVIEGNEISIIAGDLTAEKVASVLRSIQIIMRHDST